MQSYVGDQPAVLVTGIDIPDGFENALSKWFIVRNLGEDPRVAATVFIAPRLGMETAERLDILRRELPCTPVVLITAGSMNNLRGLKDVLVEEVAFFEDGIDAVVTRIMSVTKVGAIERFLDQLAYIPELDERLRSALMVACRSKPLIRTVGMWAKKSRLSRSTLRRLWAASRISNEWSPSSFLSMLVAYQYLERLRAGRRKAEAARAMGVDVRTAESACRELLRIIDSVQSGKNALSAVGKSRHTATALCGRDMATVMTQLFDGGSNFRKFGIETKAVTPFK